MGKVSYVLALLRSAGVTVVIPPECPYDELEISRRFPNTPMSLPARLLLCEGYRRADAIWYMYNDNPQYDRHDDAHQTAQALACGEFE